MDPVVCQVNLQAHFGGGEVYTAFLCRALSRLGYRTLLFVHPRAGFWHGLGLPPDTTLAPLDDIAAAAASLPAGPLWLLGHGPLPAPLRTPLAGRLRTAVAHMPLQGRDPRSFDGHDRVFAVSGWVRDGLAAAGAPVWPEPLYGVADIAQRPGAGPLRRRSRYDWDRRKVRDRVLAQLEPLAMPVLPRPVFQRRPGLTLGIVSRLTPIKQFPLQFSLLAPLLADVPQVNLEIFGSGGYASVRDLARALTPIEDRARFWGHQHDVAAVYRQLDYLMAGLPEKEALGLNVIEAQACGTPVLAVDAPPFTETVVEGTTGFFYRDPRQDGGADFAALMARLIGLRQPLRPQQATAHLAGFSFDALVERLRPVVAWAQQELGR